MSENTLTSRARRLATTAVSEDVAGLTQAASADGAPADPQAAAVLDAAAAFAAAGRAYLADLVG